MKIAWGKVALLFLACFAITGCGYHLVSTKEMPFVSAYVVSKDELTIPIALELERKLAKRKVTITPVISEAQAVIYLDKFEQKRRVLSVSARGTPKDYLLYLVLDWHVDYWNKGKREGTWIANAKLDVAQQMSFDDNILLSKEIEQSMLWEGMSDDILDRLIRRLSQANYSLFTKRQRQCLDAPESEECELP